METNVDETKVVNIVPEQSGRPNLEPLERSGESEGLSITYNPCTGRISLGHGAFRTFIPAQE